VPAGLPLGIDDELEPVLTWWDIDNGGILGSRTAEIFGQSALSILKMEMTERTTSFAFES
jgi:hypothetical protein